MSYKFSVNKCDEQSMTYEKALFILKHGSVESLQTYLAYLDAIEVVENHIKALEKKSNPSHEKSLEKRLKHLLESEYIASFDEKNHFKNEYIKDIHKADEAIYALSRHNPRKPIAHQEEKDGDYYTRIYILCCGNCATPLYHTWHKSDYKPNYCHYCGQAIDWSKYNDD